MTYRFAINLNQKILTEQPKRESCVLPLEQGKLALNDMGNETQNRDPIPGTKKNLDGGPPKKETILVVDDEELIRILTESFLEQLGYKVLLADCGEDAVDIFKEKSTLIQLVLSDITMPGIDGIETIRQLRQIAPDLRAIISSGYSSERIDSFPENTVFLPKPYSLTELQIAISAINAILE